MSNSSLLQLYSSKAFIAKMSVQEIRNKYSSTSFGLFWAYAHPILLLGAMWFFVGTGLKGGPANGNFLVWLAPGLICWNYISECINSTSSSVSDYAFFLKRQDLPIESAIIIRILAITLIHSVFVVVLFGMEVLAGVSFGWSWAMVLYYFFCAFCLNLSVGFVTSAIYPFFKDIAYLTGIVTQFGFWLSPVLWDPNHFPSNIRVLANLNPVAYIIEGYRKSLLPLEHDTTHNMSGIYFWSITFFIFLSGRYLFKKMKPHFADVLNG